MRRGVLVAFSEIGIRSTPVRRRLIGLLRRNIKRGLRWLGVEFEEVVSTWDRLFIFAEEGEKIASLLRDVPGVRFAAPIYYLQRADVDALLQELGEKLSKEVSGRTFRVETKRRDKSFPMNSMEISALVGKELLTMCEGSKVCLDRPEVTVHVEIGRDYSLLYTRRFEGVGGYPVGAQSPLVVLLSGGTDSAVAMWLVLHRGCEVYPLFINQSPFTGCCYIERAYHVFNRLREKVMMPDMKLATAKVGRLMEDIVLNVKPSNICVHCKRVMMRVAEGYARKMGAMGIITGESIGQVASQTVDNLYVISLAISLPIYRPLAGMSKEMIHEMAKRAGIYEIAARSIPYCDILPPHPTTRAKLEEIQEEEKMIGVNERVREIVERIEIYGESPL